MARKIQINISNKVFYTLITFSLMIIFGVVVYAYNSGYGDPAIFGHSADEIEGGGSMSSGSIISFYLSSCPTGWILADGANGTPDLRGAFIRCMYGDQNGRDVARILGSFQNDLFKSHAHSSLAQGGYEWGRGDWVYSSGGTSAGQTGLAGGDETRPKNVALIYCMKT